MKAAVTDIAYHLPSRAETNADLAREFPAWNAEKIGTKTGINARHIAGAGECASDLGVKAAEKLFQNGAIRRDEIDFLLFCTQTPDYFLPTTSCIMQERLGLRPSTGALDFNLGCSGYIYGLSLAKGLIETGQARTVLLVTADTYSKLLKPNDRNVRTIFGDAAAATLVRSVEDAAADRELVGPFVFGTDGRGAPNLIVKQGAFRARSAVEFDTTEPLVLEMNGPEIFNFTLRVVPETVRTLLQKDSIPADAVDLFFPHQANQYMLDHLRDKMSLPKEKFFVGLRDCGNTVSASIPIALADAAGQGLLKRDALLMLIGFGVGYSWGAGLIRWRGQ